EAGHDDQSSDAGVLVDGAEAAENHAVADAHVTGDDRAVHHRDIIAEDAVVADVGADHHEGAVADAGGGVVVGRGVDGDVLTDLAACAEHDSGGGGAGGELEVLGPEAEAGAGVDHGPRPDLQGPEEVDPGDEPHAAAEADGAAPLAGLPAFAAGGEHAVGADFDAVSEVDLAAEDGGG